MISTFPSNAALYAQYWAAFDQKLAARRPVWAQRSQSQTYWKLFPLGRDGVHIAAVIAIPPRKKQRCMRVELALEMPKLGADAERLHGILKERADEWSASLGADLDWTSASNHQYQVGVNLPECDPFDVENWPHQQDVVIDWLDRFYDHFGHG
ncbi:MAG: DUF4268 domain-containing protein [Planctomycetota bacterium]|jgi:hypothetical protein